MSGNKKNSNKQTTMSQFFKPLPTTQNQTLETTPSNLEENKNKFQYLFEREEIRRKKKEQEEKENMEKLAKEERERKAEIKRILKQAKKEQFEKDQKQRWEEEKLKYEGKQIIPGLYLGSRLAAKNLDWINGNISAILNVSQEVKNYFEGKFVCKPKLNENQMEIDSDELNSSDDVPILLKYKRIISQDAIDQNLIQFFDESILFIEETINDHGAVLVHCREGLSRSPSTIIAFLMKKMGWDLKKSYNHVLECNKKLRINDGFKRQLMEFEFSIFNSNSFDFFDKRSRSGTSRTCDNKRKTSKQNDTKLPLTCTSDVSAVNDSVAELEITSEDKENQSIDVI